MKASPQQLRDALRLTKDFLNVRSESDLESALEVFAHITRSESILALNFKCDGEPSSLLTNASFHLSNHQQKCEKEVITSNPLFKMIRASFENQDEQAHNCTPPCGGIGTFMGEKDIHSNSVTTLFMVTKEKSLLIPSNEISQFLLPHITSAVNRYLEQDKQKCNSKINVLSTRELDVLNWIGAGKSNWETAQILGISEHTIKFHVSNICKKLNVRKRGHAIAKATQLNLIDF